MRHMKAIQNRNNEKYILLNPKILAWTDIEQVVRDSLAKVFVTEDNFSNTQLTINYDNYYADEIFKAVFPNTGEGFSSFSQVGHIIHLNLREHLLEYKSIIAQVLLDKVPRARTVVNKIDAIDNTYRNFEMEKLCGEDDMLVTIKENYCEFQFDFSKVYWNPRLSTEHERIVKTLTAGDVLFDVFAGVGPFAVPAAKKGCTVYANDLNPESFKWLNHNTKKNKVKNGNLYTYNKDGHQFIQEDLKVNLIKHINESNVIIVMNLPALAVEFLKNFCKMYSESELPNIVNPPILHVYCFAKGADCISITKKTVTEHFGFDIEHKIINIFRVRTVSNFKEMMRVTIKLDKDVLVGRDGGKRKVVMGKKKAKQIKNVIKVVGAKNVKMKNKAKPVNAQLKRINIKNKDKVLEMDKKLVEFRKELLDKTNKKVTVSPDQTASVAETVEDYKNLEKKSDETLQELDHMELQDS
ncbi:hypothetical protein RN001_005425 [Aquatica leii]|uniref:tRNA (guanine(37)-N1)-methyltransferase n=1 Tax=Aquatica leii TaxID=1421715 RepID=A0AAN7SAK5_9COLE|nr:hypothetical protein RN001_005425 [Aquatica leii]